MSVSEWTGGHTQAQLEGYERQRSSWNARTEEIHAAMPDCRIRITRFVSVFPRRRPPVGSVWDAKKMFAKYDQPQGYWIPDKSLGAQGVIVYDTECEVLSI